MKVKILRAIGKSDTSLLAALAEAAPKENVLEYAEGQLCDVPEKAVVILLDRGLAEKAAEQSKAESKTK